MSLDGGDGNARKNDGDESMATRSTSPVSSVAASEDGTGGEFRELIQSLDEDDDSSLPPAISLVESYPNATSDYKRTLSGTIIDETGDEQQQSLYGHPLSPEEAKKRIPPRPRKRSSTTATTAATLASSIASASSKASSKTREHDRFGGLVWHATIIPDEYFVDGQLKKGLNRKDFDVENRRIKPRRPSLPVTATDFFSSLTKVIDNDDTYQGATANGNSGPSMESNKSPKRGAESGSRPRYIFYGILNGWPSLRCFELLSLEARRGDSLVLPTAKELLTGQILWRKVWHVDQEGAQGIEPQPPSEHQVYRAKLRGPPWTSMGWSQDSPGFVFWFERQRPEGPRLSYGTNLLKTLGDEICTTIHMVSHRYAVLRESARDRLTYHSVCFLEWDHGNYGTVVEAAYLNGVGGYKGKCNWYDDKDAKETVLYRALPPEMICPWLTTHAEIRCYDVAARNLYEFKAYIDKYTGHDQRFVDPHVSFSHAARLTFRSKKHVAQYLLNYIQRDQSYNELKRNCQTFTADLCSFIAGKRNVPPFHPVSRIDYQNRTYLFLYDHHMY